MRLACAGKIWGQGGGREEGAHSAMHAGTKPKPQQHPKGTRPPSADDQGGWSCLQVGLGALNHCCPPVLHLGQPLRPWVPTARAAEHGTGPLPLGVARGLPQHCQHQPACRGPSRQPWKWDLKVQGDRDPGGAPSAPGAAGDCRARGFTRAADTASRGRGTQALRWPSGSGAEGGHPAGTAQSPRSEGWGKARSPRRYLG